MGLDDLLPLVHMLAATLHPGGSSMHKQIHRTSVLAVFCLTLAFTTVAWAADDPANGTWKMNPEKSKYSPGPAPQSTTTVIESDATHEKIDSHTVNADGTETHISFDAKTDGKDYPLSGAPNADMISLKRFDANTLQTTWKKDGKVVMTTRGVVSKDGKTRTVTFNGTDPDGKKVHNVVVYDKEM
jgi:hypothetical protein